MFQNLRAEMVRYGIKTQDIADRLGVNQRTIHNKLKGSTEWTVPEAVVVCEMFVEHGKYFAIEELFVRGVESV